MLWRTLWKGSMYLADSWGLWPRDDAAIDVMIGALKAKKKGKVGANIAWAMRMALRTNSLVDHPDSLHYETSSIISGMIDGCRFHTGLEGKALNEMMNAVDAGNEDRALEIQGALWEFEDSDSPYTSIALTIHEPVVDTSLEDRLYEVYGDNSIGDSAVAASKFSGGWHTETDMLVKADQLHQVDLMSDNYRELPSAGLELPDDMQRDDYPTPLPEEYQPTEKDLRQLAKEMAIPVGPDWAPWQGEDQIFFILSTHISRIEYEAHRDNLLRAGYFDVHNDIKRRKIKPIKVTALKPSGVVGNGKMYTWDRVTELGRIGKGTLFVPPAKLDSFMEQASQLAEARVALEYL